MPKPLIVGESNPGSDSMRWALYPSPNGCAGHRLCVKILGMDPDEYLATFHRTNIFLNYAGPWKKEHMLVAMERAYGLADNHSGLLVALGKRVGAAFGHPVFFEPVPWGVDRDVTLLCIPHPSGLCRVWNEPGVMDRARELVRSLL